MDISTARTTLLLIISFITTLSGFAMLHPDEVKTLEIIAKKTGMSDWDFKKDPCSGQGNRAPDNVYIRRRVYCYCHVIGNSSTCHISGIELSGQNLSGRIPPEFSKFKYLSILDLSHNCFTGSVPSEWATMNLVLLNLMGNKLSGPFPLVLTKISTLQILKIDENNFSGHIPSELQMLKNLKTLFLSSNGFTGKFPLEIFKLAKLTNLILSNTGFTGKIPNKHIQGTLLEGPIPTSIASVNLTDLRISDLKGKRSSRFPDLSKMKSLRILIMRGCLLTGNIPKYLGNLEMLHMLDLSFNSLTGEISGSLIQSINVQEMYFKRNKLTGPIPPWITLHPANIDISENNFTWNGSGPTECLQGKVNMAESYSSYANNVSQVESCLKQGFPCASQQYYSSLRINCGGKEVIVADEKSKYLYEADFEATGSAAYYGRKNWAVTSTGEFMEDYIESYVKHNSSALVLPDASFMEPLYTTARASPLSLVYYGLCLLNGNYTVNLHFAEIVFTNYINTFTSLGRRIFDVYVQLVLKDFDIAQEAGGAATPIVKTFIAKVAKNTLKIHLYWAGRGTQGLPVLGTYGPLISAIEAFKI